MLETMAKHWWVVLLRGAASLIFGIIALLNPGIALEAIITVFGAFALVDGALAIFQAVQNRTKPRWWSLLLEGLVSILAGLGALLFPGITAIIVVTIIGVWAVMTGIFEIITAIELRKEIKGEFYLGLAGVISIIFGVLLFLFPITGALTLITVIGVSSLIFGVVLILLAFRVRGLDGQQPTPTPT